MREKYTAEFLAARERGFDDLAIEYGFQRNLLICLKDLTKHPNPITDFEIGLAPMHPSNLILTDCPEENLDEIIDIARELDIDFISGADIEKNVFTRMYKPENCLQIFLKTLNYLIDLGYKIRLDIAFGAALIYLRRYHDGLEEKPDEERIPLLDAHLVSLLSNISHETDNLENMLSEIQNLGLSGNFSEMVPCDASKERIGGEYLNGIQYIPNLRCELIIPNVIE